MGTQGPEDLTVMARARGVLHLMAQRCKCTLGARTNGLSGKALSEECGGLVAHTHRLVENVTLPMARMVMDM